jgi:hypothetical protein
VTRDDARERDEAQSRQRTPQEWLDLAELGRHYRRRLGHLQEELRSAAAQLPDEYAEHRARINHVVLPGIQADIDDGKRLIRKAELFAEYSGRRRPEARETR